MIKKFFEKVKNVKNFIFQKKHIKQTKDVINIGLNYHFFDETRKTILICIHPSISRRIKIISIFRMTYYGISLVTSYIVKTFPNSKINGFFYICSMISTIGYLATGGNELATLGLVFTLDKQ